MRVKKPYVVLTFHTTTDAMAMEKQCQDAGIPGRIIPLPREISAGCGLSWRMKAEDYPIYEQQVYALHIPTEGCYTVEL